MNRTMNWIGIGLLSLLVLVVLSGVLIELWLIDTEENTVALPHLPSAWEGRRLAVVADYQIGMRGANTGTMRRITERLVEERPVAVLLADDFLYKGENPAEEIQKAVEIQTAWFAGNAQVQSAVNEVQQAAQGFQGTVPMLLEHGSVHTFFREAGDALRLTVENRTAAAPV